MTVGIDTLAASRIGRAPRARTAQRALYVIVAQAGARRRYAVPRMLHSKGALDRLYTDLAFAPGPRPTPSWLGGRVARRTVKGLPTDKVYRAPWVTIGAALLRNRPPAETFLWMDDVFGERMTEWGVGKANAIYGMFGSGTPFWRKARAEGLKVACDMFITPMWYEIVDAERRRFPDWELPTDDGGRERALFAELNRRCMSSADVLICPSETVRDGVTAFLESPHGQDITIPATYVVPYGIAATKMARQMRPHRGRILFAGSAELRKGIHTLAAAERRLNARAPRYDMRVAGHASDRVQNHPIARGLTFLGSLSRAQLDTEYAGTDLLVLPTLAEGSPAVLHEALALGIPVVTTHSAGSVVTSGREGLIVPCRDHEALADAIARIVDDRALRSTMSRNALQTAQRFDEGPWADRLMAAMETLLD